MIDSKKPEESMRDISETSIEHKFNNLNKMTPWETVPPTSVLFDTDCQNTEDKVKFVKQASQCVGKLIVIEEEELDKRKVSANTVPPRFTAEASCVRCDSHLFVTARHVANTMKTDTKYRIFVNMDHRVRFPLYGIPSGSWIEVDILETADRGQPCKTKSCPCLDFLILTAKDEIDNASSYDQFFDNGSIEKGTACGLTGYFGTKYDSLLQVCCENESHSKALRAAVFTVNKPLYWCKKGSITKISNDATTCDSIIPHNGPDGEGFSGSMVVRLRDSSFFHGLHVKRHTAIHVNKFSQIIQRQSAQSTA